MTFPGIKPTKSLLVLYIHSPHNSLLGYNSCYRLCTEDSVVQKQRREYPLSCRKSTPLVNCMGKKCIYQRHSIIFTQGDNAFSAFVTWYLLFLLVGPPLLPSRLLPSLSSSHQFLRFPWLMSQNTQLSLGKTDVWLQRGQYLLGLLSLDFLYRQLCSPPNISVISAQNYIHNLK